MLIDTVLEVSLPTPVLGFKPGPHPFEADALLLIYIRNLDTGF